MFNHNIFNGKIRVFETVNEQSFILMQPRPLISTEAIKKNEGVSELARE